jgi:hypothetical protein
MKLAKDKVSFKIKLAAFRPEAGLKPDTLTPQAVSYNMLSN